MERGRLGCFVPALIAAAILAASIGPAPASAADKDYYFPQVRVAVAVERDGSFIVDEFRTFEFQGSFHFAYIVIPLRLDQGGVRRDVEISELSMTDEQGRALKTEISESGGELTAKWFYSAEDERRTFHIHYRVSGGITSYPDVTELYWQVISGGWDKPARDVQVTVTLPDPVPSKADLLVWAHGPLAGWSEVVDERTARFSAPDLAARQYFEVRVVWPEGLVSGVPSGRPALDAIRAEEAGYVQDTIARVQRAQADVAGRRQRDEANKRKMLKLLGVWGIWQIVGPLIWLVVFFRVWSAVGKDYRFGSLPDYVRELPADRPPAVVQSLMREGRTVTPAAFTATIFDLARRGILEIEDRNVSKKRLFGTKEIVETTITLKKDPGEDIGLRPFERSLLAFLYEEQAGWMSKGASLTVDELQDYLKKNPQKFQTWYRAWTKAVKDEVKPLRFLEPESVRARNRFYLFTLPVAV
ncbi:MAG: DUF2207 domain-containing protein, partial [Candidatus Aminicenantales bacterium]